MARSKCAKCEALMCVILDIWWMARRYADGRLSYAPDMFNRALDKAIANGLVIGHPDTIADPPSIYAKEGRDSYGH